MKSRPNPRQSIYNRLHRHELIQTEPRRPARSDRPSFPIHTMADTQPVEPQIQLEDEISMGELTQFVMECIEKLASDRDQALEELIKAAIAEKLPTYTALKSELIEARKKQRKQHVWTKQMVEAVEPLLKNNSAPMAEQERLSDLAVKCVELSMQLQACAKQLQLRVAFLEEAVAQHLVNVGTEVGFPEALMQKLSRLTRSVLEQSE